ncbi:hypothetical protein BG015_001127 [Linnemannia schmuckeri]|uniref:L domain-like protein n=1 Tax=Linnemannia schmuckeri TaxID=64567 RepID=A0A9P5VFK8_9FUNG|nr:hypothetical protein BG015_001127 [Linnemannia schmuckeri]
MTTNGQNPDEGSIDDDEEDDDNYDDHDDHGEPCVHNPVKHGPRRHVKDDWYIIELSIANNDFDGLIPEGLFTSLTKLRVINSNQNGFTVTLLESGRHHFSGELPDALFDLQNLKVLDLPDNKLTGNLTPRIGNMISLTRLVLVHNELTGPLPVELQNLTRMEYMVVNYNQFDGLFPIANAPTQMVVCLVQPNEPRDSSEKYDEILGAVGLLALQWSTLVVTLTAITTILQLM